VWAVVWGMRECTVDNGLKNMTSSVDSCKDNDIINTMWLNLDSRYFYRNAYRIAASKARSFRWLAMLAT